MDERKYGTDYTSNFDPEVYLKSYYSDISGSTSEGDFMITLMTDFHEIYANGNIKGRRLLDIGTGPTIHSLISAAPHCEVMFLSDYTPQNLATLKRWHDDKLAHSFHKLIEFVLDLENKGEIVPEREKSMRDKVSGILPLDLLQENPFHGVLLPEFDIVTSSLCIEAVARDLSEYESIARRISKMVKVGGHVVLFGVLGETFYKVGEASFYCLKLKGEQVKQTWEKCGFTITTWKQSSSHVNEFNTVSDFEGIFLMTAQKI